MEICQKTKHTNILRCLPTVLMVLKPLDARRKTSYITRPLAVFILFGLLWWLRVLFPQWHLRYQIQSLNRQCHLQIVSYTTLTVFISFILWQDRFIPALHSRPNFKSPDVPKSLTPGCFWIQKSGEHGTWLQPLYCYVFLFLVHGDADLLSMAVSQKH